MSNPSAEKKKKRKHSSPTIPQLFTTQQKPLSSSSGEPPASPSTKRMRMDNKPDSPQLPSPLPLANMYDFPWNNKQTEIVDLTKSPDLNGRTSNAIRRPAVFNPHVGAKRLVVKNFRTTSTFDQNQYLEEQWAKLDKALDNVFAGHERNFSLEELYRGVQNLCLQKRAEVVCQRLEKKCAEHVAGPMKAPLRDQSLRTNVDVLKATLAAWQRWNVQLKDIYWIFCYMDRDHLLRKQQSLQDIAVNLFRTIIFEDTRLTSRIIHGACDLVTADRDGGVLDQETLSGAIAFFHALGVYTTYFEPQLLEVSQDFIAHWADETCKEKPVEEYVEACLNLIMAEEKRIEAFQLDKTTRRDLLSLLDDHLVQRKENRLANADDLADLLDKNAQKSLRDLYRLLERRRLGVKLRPAFEKWIEDTGTAIVFDEKDQDNMVVKLLVLKKQLDNIWKDSFQRNEEIGHGLREAFETFMNKTKKSSSNWNTNNSKPGEMIAKYVDLLLRGGSKAIPAQLSAVNKDLKADEEDEVEFDEDSEVNNQLDQVLDLFRFLHGKDVFEAFYKKDLARRLLMGRSASADAERSMLARLKTECGGSFTANLEQMFKDVELAREELNSYKQLLSDRNDKHSFDLNVNILSAAAWPTYPDVEVIIPQQVKNALDKFEQYYKSKHSGRKLTWKHALAHSQLKAVFPQGKKELIVSSFQAIILLLFNGQPDGTKISYEELKQATGLPPAELARTLQSLACAKLRPLTKHPKGRDINPTDSFSLNLNFSDPRYRIKINTVQLKETKQENKETHERVAADRSLETQAAIVRILKSKKKAGHQEVVTETINLLKKRGHVEIATIKQAIDRLIEKEYIEREDDGSYAYVA